MNENDKSEKVCAVVVTYNRLELLKECLAALKAQTRPADLILIVDNGSTDATASWLAEQSGITVVTQKNLGGAGGFHTGIGEAFARGYDWFWCLDDDTIAAPACLERLIVAQQVYRDSVPARPLVAQQVYRDSAPARPLGWLCSKVSWTDGTPHLMNEPKVSSFLEWGMDVLEKKYVTAEWCSYVSVMISREAVARCGLPLKEMFIWFDDVEHTARIQTSGFTGLVVLDSEVEHRTTANYEYHVRYLEESNKQRFFLAFRNEILFMRTVYGSNPLKLFWKFSILMLKRAIALATSGKIRFLGPAILWGFKGILFQRRIERPA